MLADNLNAAEIKCAIESVERKRSPITFWYRFRAPRAPGKKNANLAEILCTLISRTGRSMVILVLLWHD